LEQKLKAQTAEHERSILILQKKFEREKVAIAHDAARNAIKFLESTVQERMRAANENINRQLALWKINWIRDHKNEGE